MRLLFVILYCLIMFEGFSQTFSWYFPWENKIKNLVIDDLDEVPLNNYGKNYRILKITSAKPFDVKSIKFKSDKIKIDAFSLPVRNGNIDVLIPLSSNLNYSKEAYFLFKFESEYSGKYNIKINVDFGRSLSTISRIINVSSFKNNNNVNINVFSYLGYNYLVKNLNSQVVQDLVNHKINTIIIPPYAIPELKGNSSTFIKLDRYLNELGNNFENYAIYLGGFQSKKSNILSVEWRRDFPQWFIKIKEVFKKNGIPISKIYLYPFDEPTDQNIELAEEFINYLKSNKINCKTFLTLHKEGGHKLALKYDLIQVHMRNPKVLSDVIKSGKNSSNVLNYETNVASGNDFNPRKYLDLAISAAKFNLGGYGIWSYADAKRNDLTEFNKGLGTWEYNHNKSKGDYYNSLIQRKGNKLFSTLRWEAFYFGIDEMNWLRKLKINRGSQYQIQIINRLLSRSLSTKDWEKLKLVLNGN